MFHEQWYIFHNIYKKMDLSVPVVHTTGVGTLGITARPAEAKTNYKLLECDQSLLTADQIIARWRQDRHAIARSLSSEGLTTDVWKNVSVGDECLCRMGVEEKAFTGAGACVGCNVLSRLFKQGEIATGTPFMIQIGAHTGMRMIAYTYKRGVNIGHGLAGYVNTDYPARVGHHLLEELSSLQACESSFAGHVQGTSFFACQGSPVHQYMVVSCFLENELRKGGLPTTPIFRWVFECNGDVNIVEEIPSLGRGTLAEITAVPEYLESPRSPTARVSPIIPLTADVARGLLLQLVSTLHFYSRYAFTHGFPGLHSLGFSKQPAAYMYDGMKVTAPITLHLIPSGSTAVSAASSEGKILRVYYPGTALERGIDVNLLPKITVTPFFGTKKVEVGTCARTSGSLATFTTPCLPAYTNMRVIGYKIGSNPISFTAYVRHLGIPLFHSSFDLYAFWTALMCEEPFYLAVHNDASIVDIWRQLFAPDEYDALMLDIQKYRHRKAGSAPPASDEITALLSKYHLRCDALEHVWASLKVLA